VRPSIASATNQARLCHANLSNDHEQVRKTRHVAPREHGGMLRLDRLLAGIQRHQRDRSVSTLATSAPPPMGISRAGAGAARGKLNSSTPLV
jgi:hypothetical protein